VTESTREAEMTADEAPATAGEPVPEDDQPVADEQPVAADEQPVADEPVADARPAALDESPVPADEAPTPAEDQPVAADEQPVAAVAATESAGEGPAEGRKAAAAAKPKERKAARTDAPPIEVAAAAEPAPETAPADAPATTGPRGLRLRYRAEVVPALTRQFEYANPNQVPRVDKIVVNIGLGEALTNAKAIDAASGDLTMITGQKPIVLKAKRSIAQFRVRAGNPIGLKVTLRGQRMWDFLERLTLLALPRIRDFRGTPGRSFDGRGNYTLGLREQIAFPEIDYDKVDRLRGLEVSIVTTAKSDEESKRLLELLGMPFAS
jgi:large subunit ribosomal protein L5